jgi:hypothetical protein
LAARSRGTLLEVAVTIAVASAVAVAVAVVVIVAVVVGRSDAYTTLSVHRG